MVLATLDSIRADHIGPPPIDRSDWTSITTVAQGTGGGRDPGGTRKQNSLVEIGSSLGWIPVQPSIGERNRWK